MYICSHSHYFSNHKYILCNWKVKVRHPKGNVPGQTVRSSGKSTGRVGPGSHPSSTTYYMCDPGYVT